MAQNKVELTGSVDKIVRANGKPGAQVVITIPAEKGNIVPLGSVYITIESAQSELDLKGSGRVRGDKA